MKIIFLFVLLLFSSTMLAQDVNNAILIRQDTAELRPDTAVIESILQAIGKNRLKAIDYFSDEVIPAIQIYTWKKAIDTIVLQNEKGQMIYKPVQQKRKAADFSRIRVLQNWYLDHSKGMIFSRILEIQLLEERQYMGFTAFSPFCRIKYP